MDDMFDLSERKRAHAPLHRRPVEIQQLDALLRIEEILARAYPEPTTETTSPAEMAAKQSPEAPKAAPASRFRRK